MTSFKNPTFQDRASQAAAAKQKALEQLRLRPTLDEAEINQRKAAEAQRESTRAGKAAARKAAAEEAAKSKAIAKEKACAPALTDADRKAARDARYAARQARSAR